LKGIEVCITSRTVHMTFDLRLHTELQQGRMKSTWTRMGRFILKKNMFFLFISFLSVFHFLHYSDSSFVSFFFYLFLLLSFFIF
jgi:hypothetical protein